jgi:predicted CXXCH cytochrome family protein
MHINLRRLSGILLLLGLLAPALLSAEEFVGSNACKSCHQQAWQSWLGSHHYQAMLPASDETVLGDFGGREFEYGGVKSRFFRRDGKFMVETDNSAGELEEFEIAYTFGFHPLQQYLIPFPGGRYQALNIVWDNRPQSEGGQRWVHLYPDQENPVTHRDLVHWTGSFQNWNSRCASCHSTGLEKNYSSASNRYDTSWKEINVACEACHGPASAHLEWTNGDRQDETRGFPFSLNDRGPFGPREGKPGPTFERLDGLRPGTQVETCASCHARRSEMVPHQAGRQFDDLYQLALIEPGLYYPDGQVSEEVYVYGSFLQSKMHGAGVVCTNCHDAHSNAVRFDDNRLCTQCHNAAIFDRQDHHHHPASSPGAACVNCHMPAKTYMVVDDRRDHSFQVPEPRLSLQYGIPNSCNQCHTDKNPQWAIEALDSWEITTATRAAHAAVLAAAWSGQSAVLPELLALAMAEDQAPIIRASAVLASRNFPSEETMLAMQQLLSSDDSLLRSSVVRSLNWLPTAQRYALLRDYIEDSSKAVRMAVARQLQDFPVDQLPGASARELRALRQEYVETMLLNADMPEEQLNLGLFYSASGDLIAAEKAYRTALRLSPYFIPAMLNLADLYRANGMDRQAKPLLQEAIRLAPGQAAPHHAMGLLLIRQGQLDEAVTQLKSAVGAEPLNYRYSYVYAVALWESGERNEAVTALEEALQRVPGNRELISALASYYQQLGEEEKLRLLLAAAKAM